MKYAICHQKESVIILFVQLARAVWMKVELLKVLLPLLIL